MFSGADVHSKLKGKFKMQLDPQIAEIIKQIPPLPPFRSVSPAELRKIGDEMSAAIPKLDVPLASVADREIATPGGNLRVRIYTPEGSGPFPLLCYFHGGGYVVGDLNSADPICRGLSAGAGCVVMSVDYRLSPEHPFPCANDDAHAAVLWASQNADEINADPGRLAVGGDSAGANLSAAVTLRAREAGGPKLVAQLLMYPSPSYPDTRSASFLEYAAGPLMTADDALYFWDQYLPNLERDRINPDACALHASNHRGLPPAFVANAECDPTLDSGEAYADALQAAGVPTMRRIYSGLPHGFFGWIGFSKKAEAAMAELSAWLKQQFAGTAS
jgi:acetyl esterase